MTTVPRVTLVCSGLDHARRGYESFARECFDALDAPVIRVTSEDVPMPYAKTLEKAYLPQPEKIIDAVHRVMYR